MTTYKGINGFAVQSVATDPSPLDEGQVWYNNATYAFKLATIVADAWASGGNLNTSRTQAGTAGTQTSIIVFNGAGDSPSAVDDSSEKYNGTNWTSAAALPNTKYRPVGVGTQTAALSISGVPISNGPTTTAGTASYNGTSWTAITDVGTGRMTAAGAGTQTAALFFGGFTYAPGVGANFQNLTEEWNGSAWTSGGTLPTAKGALAGFGTQTAGVAATGQVAPPTVRSNTTEEYNGTSWTAGGNTNQSKLGTYGTGTLTAGLIFGGNLPAETGQTERYDGTSWATSPASLNTARSSGSVGSAGSQAAAICVSGGSPTTVVEEWTGTAVGTKTITTS